MVIATRVSALGRSVAPLRGRISLRELTRAPEWARYFWQLLVIYPAASRLPLRVTLRLTAAWGSIEALMPTLTARLAREEIAAATGGRRGRRAFRLVARRLSRRQRSLALWRFVERHGLDADWKFIETNPKPARAVLASDAPVLFVGGHFQATADFLAFAALLGETEMPATVQSSKAPWSLSPKVLRTRLGFDISTRAHRKLFPASASRRHAYMPYLWGGGDEVWQAAPRRTGVQEQIIEALARPRGRALIYADAIWEKGSAHRRPFAGAEARGFALGAGRIARRAQATIIPFVATHGRDPMTIHVEWADPIEPPAVDDDVADHPHIDQVLDFLERGVGRHPDNHSLPIGWDRYWDARTREWRPRTD